MKSESSAMK